MKTMEPVIYDDDGCMDTPMFTGTDPSLWIPKVERLFNRGCFSDDAKLDLVFLFLGGVALTWFMREMSKEKMMDWSVFKQRLLAQFDPVKSCSSQVPSATDLISNCESEVESTCPVKICSSSEAILATKSLGGGESIVTDSSIVEIHSSSEKESDHVSPDIEDIQVSVSNLEPSLSLCSEPLNVFEAWPCEIVWGNQEHPQSVFGSVKNRNYAHKVFDGLFLRSHRLQRKKKLSLSPKSWKFKFKNMTVPRNMSQMALLQVIESSTIKSRYHCSSVGVGLVKKKGTLQRLRLKHNAHMSRVLHKMRMMHDPGGMKPLLHGELQITLVLQGDMKSMFFSITESKKSYRDSDVQPRLQVSLAEIELQQGQGVNIALISTMSQLHNFLGYTLEKKFVTWLQVAYVLSNIGSLLVRLMEKSSNSWKFASSHESEGLQQHNNQFGPRALDDDTIYIAEKSSEVIIMVLHSYRKHKFVKTWKFKYKDTFASRDFKCCFEATELRRIHQFECGAVMLNLMNNCSWVSELWRRNLCKNWWFKFKAISSSNRALVLWGIKQKEVAIEFQFHNTQPAVSPICRSHKENMLLWIHVSKLEDKLVLNEGSNEETDTCLGNGTLRFLQSHDFYSLHLCNTNYFSLWHRWKNKEPLSLWVLL